MTAVQFLRRIVTQTRLFRFPHVQVVHPGKDEAQHDESARRLTHDRKAGIPALHTHIEQSARGEKFAERTQQHQCQREPEAHTDPVRRREDDPVFGGERFRTAEYDTVHHDQREKDPQRVIDRRRSKRLHEHIHDRHKGCNDHDINGDANLVRHNAAHHGNDHIAADQHKRGGDPHGERVGGVGGGGKRGAHAQSQNQDRVFLPDPFLQS